MAENLGLINWPTDIHYSLHHHCLLQRVNINERIIVHRNTTLRCHEQQLLGRTLIPLQDNHTDQQVYFEIKMLT